MSQADAGPDRTSGTDGGAGLRSLVTGATGYVGGRLVPELLDAGHRVRCLARSPHKLRDHPWAGRAEVVRGDVTDADSVARAMKGVDVAYYLVHALGTGDDFEATDRRAARTFAERAEAAGVRRIVYLGGLTPAGVPEGELSPHLRSRAEVGRILLASGVPTTVLRAAVVIGSGSASFEMLRYLTERLPSTPWSSAAWPATSPAPPPALRGRPAGSTPPPLRETGLPRPSAPRSTATLHRRAPSPHPAPPYQAIVQHPGPFRRRPAPRPAGRVHDALGPAPRTTVLPGRAPRPRCGARPGGRRCCADTLRNRPKRRTGRAAGAAVPGRAAGEALSCRATPRRGRTDGRSPAGSRPGTRTPRSRPPRVARQDAARGRTRLRAPARRRPRASPRRHVAVR